MAAGVRKLAIYESKPTSGFACRGTGSCLSDFAKERNYHVTNRPAVSGLREHALPRISSALFDLELGEGEEDLYVTEEKSVVIQRMEVLLTAHSPTEKQVQNDVQFLALRHSNRRVGMPFNFSDYDASALAADLQSLGYTVNIRRSVGGGTGAEGMNNLSHRFLRCTPPGASDVFIVDPKFRDQFDILHPTPSYRHVWESIPALLVIHEDHIAPIVELLCEEMAKSFKSKETPLPPWRRMRSLLSKWQPRQSMDIAIPKPTASVTEPAEAFGRSVPIHIHGTKPIFMERKPQKPIGLNAGWC